MIKKLLKILTPGDRKKISVLLGVNIASSLAGLLGIASIVPFISILSNPAKVSTDYRWRFIFDHLHFNSVTTFIIYMGFLLLFVFIMSNMVMLFSAWYSIHFARRISNNLTCSLMNYYLSNDYHFFLRRNSTDIVKNLFSEVNNVVNQIIKPSIDILSKGLLSAAIIILIILISPATAFIVIGVMGGFYALIYALIRKRLTKAGKERLRANRSMYHVAGEVFGGIKDVKLLGKEKLYLYRFALSATDLEKHQSYVTTMSQLPKYVLETIAFGGVLAFVLLLFITNRDLSEILPLIGLYTFAGYRLMPAIDIIFKSMALIRGNVASLDILTEDIHGKVIENKNIKYNPAVRTDPMPFSGAIELKDLVFSYEGTSIDVLKGVNLRIEKNQTVGFVGATGCGKTTTVDIILALLRPVSGEVLIDGEALTAKNRRNWQQRLGYVAQQIFLADDSVIRNIAFGIDDEYINMDSVIQAAKIANIHEFVSTQMARGYNTVVGERGIRLSGGQRQRIGIARALYTNPDVIVFDEATSALDNVTEAAVMEAIDNLMGTRTIIIIAHRLSTVKKCDRIFFMNKGEVRATGTFDELMDTSPEFREMAGESTGLL